MPVQQTKTKQTAKQQQVVKINIGEMPKKKRRTRRRKPSTKKPTPPPQSISIIQPFYQPMYPSFTPTIPQFMPPAPPAIPPPFAEGIKIKEKKKEPLLPEPEMPLAEPPVQRPSIGRRFAQGVVAGLGALGSLGEPREITEMPHRRPFPIPKTTQTLPPETRTKKVGTEPVGLSGRAIDITTIEPSPLTVQQERAVQQMPQRELIEVPAGRGIVQMMEREFVPPAPAVEPSRLPTSEERQMIREARLRAIPQPEPMAVPTPTPVLETSAPQQIALNINSFSYGDLLSAYTGMKRAIGREDFVPVMRQGRPVSKPTKKELYNYFDELGALDVIYENRD